MSKLILSGNIIINDKKEIYLLYRNKHAHYETPGGKVEVENPSEEDIKKTAERELLEEVKNIKIISMNYLDCVDFIIPDGRKATAYKFITKISGEPEPNEDIFDKEKSKWIPINELQKESISPDLKLFLEKIKKL